MTQYLKNRIALGYTVFGTWVSSGSTAVVDILSGNFLDFIVLDAEHGPIDAPQAYNLMLASKSPTLVRVPTSYDYVLSRWMDAGAAGLIVPKVEYASQVDFVKRSINYPPDGNRGVGYAKSNTYGTYLNKNSMKNSNNAAIVVVQIETKSGVDNLDAILDAGPDVVMIGPWDLSASLGMPGEFARKEFNDAICTILSKCNRAGVAPGIHVPDPNKNEALCRMGEGFRFIAYGMDLTFLLRGIDEIALIRMDSLDVEE